MTRGLFLLTMVLMMIGLTPSIVGAQAGDTVTLLLADGYSVLIPESWTVEENEADDEDETTPGVRVYSQTIDIRVLVPSEVLALSGIETASHPADVVLMLFEALHDKVPDDKRPIRLAINAIPTGRLEYTASNGGDGRLLVFEVGENTFAALDIVTPPGDRSGAEIFINEMIRTFESSSELSEEAVQPGAPAEPCTVRASSGNAVALRVGPGLHRSSVAFLPTNADFAATGRFVAEDGGVWFQMDKTQVAPQSAANELWLAATDVTAQGDCDRVGSTDAPPVIPFSNNPPPVTAVPTTQSDTPSGDTPSEQPSPVPAANPATGSLPVTGTWSTYLDATMLMSCEGTDTIRVPTTEIVDSLTLYTGPLAATRDGSSINYGGDILPLVPGEPTYIGSVTLEDGSNGQLRLTVISPTAMSGSLVVNFVIDGLPCSATIPITSSPG